MIILTNCLTETVDEGGLKVANSLVKHIKKADPSVTVISCGREAKQGDLHFPCNKLMINLRLWRYLHQNNEKVLYIPAVGRMLPTAVRIAVLSVYTRRKLQALLVMKSPVGGAAKCLLKFSGAEIMVLSEDAYEHYRAIVGSKARRIRAGVDTERFVPVKQEKKQALRAKYGIPMDKPVVLHVGHLTQGRNLSHLLSIDSKYHVVLLASTYANNTKDEALREQLLSRKNITLIHRYVPAVEEIYQLSDVYFFPVVKEQCCIDVPLSALEAAACGLPVVATPYGELKVLSACEGFCRIDDLEAETINERLDQAIAKGVGGRNAILAYDWRQAVEALRM